MWDNIRYVCNHRHICLDGDSENPPLGVWHGNIGSYGYDAAACVHAHPHDQPCWGSDPVFCDVVKTSVQCRPIREEEE